jgi:Icc-related predicted phosphoesterase
MHGMIRIAAAGDVHCRPEDRDRLLAEFAELRGAVDVVLLAGDLTTHGEPEQAAVLAEACAGLDGIPVVAVLGNHDFEAGRTDEIRRILNDVGVTLLDGEACEIHGIGFAGIKGFAGGFGRGTLGYWGEQAIKQFVQEAIDEALKLEAALMRLRTPQRIAVLHYAPIRATVEGEPPEIFPYLGCSRLEEPLTRHPVTAVFHGHAHHGSPEGRTVGDIPVYNVSMSLLGRTFPDRPPFRVLEVPRGPRADVPGAADGTHPAMTH